MPRGLRRSEPAHPPVGSTIGSTTITKPLDADPHVPGHVHGTSNPANEKDVGQRYSDTAEQQKPQTKLVNEKPLVLGK